MVKPIENIWQNHIFSEIKYKVSHPSHASDSDMPNESAMQLAFVLRIGPVTLPERSRFFSLVSSLFVFVLFGFILVFLMVKTLLK